MDNFETDRVSKGECEGSRGSENFIKNQSLEFYGIIKIKREQIVNCCIRDVKCTLIQSPV